MSHIEAYVYGAGAATGADTTLDTYQTIGLDEGGGVVKVRINASGRLTDALATLQTNANAAVGLAITYSISISTAGVVTIADNAGASAFTLTFYGSAGDLLGFSDAAYTGGRGYSSDKLASGWIELIGFECEPLAPGDRVELTQYRHGRAVALGFGNVDLFRSSLYITSTAYGPQIAKAVGDGGGYALTGRVRIQSRDANPYSASNPDGYIDGFIVETPELETYGSGERFARIGVVVAVPR